MSFPIEDPFQEAERRIAEALGNQSKNLDLSGLALQELPESIAQLKWLEILDISKTKLKELPESIGQLTQLEELDLSYTELKEFPKSICQLTQLLELNLSDTQLHELPESIGQLVLLQKLYLFNTQLKELPESIGQLRQLQRLYLFHTQLMELPKAIIYFTQLQSLSLSHTHLKKLPESIGQLTQLQWLYLSNTQLQELPENIGQLTQLQDLYIFGTLLQVLPESIGQLTKLRLLDLDDTPLQELPESIGQLAQLQELSLSNTQLKELPDALRKLNNLEKLYLHGNPKLNIPPEILGATYGEVVNYKAKAAAPSRILDYYFRLRSGQRPLNEAKLIFVGRGNVGKTSLVKRLLFDKFDEKEERTPGIAISEWKLSVCPAEEICLNLWDFGGQEIMHATHQFFLTQRSLYLLVVEGRQGSEDADAEYWLKLIESFGTEDNETAPVVVALNKSELNPFDLNRRALRKKYPFIKAFVATDCETGYGVEELKVVLMQEIDRLPHLRDSFPSSWFAIKEKLAKMKKSFISFEQYRAICNKLGERDREGQEFLAMHLHNLGVALNYKDDIRLRDAHVLNPRWVTNGVYALLNNPELQNKGGELWLAEVAAILDPDKYPRQMHRFLLDLMRKFELCFTFSDDDTHYLIPELLDKQEPEESASFDLAECLNFEYRYVVLTEGLLPRFIVRTHALSEGHPRWRSGVILEFEGNSALVRADVQERRVFIAVNGPLEGRRRLLAVIRSDFERIHASISKLTPEEMVPLPGKPAFSVRYAELRAFEQNNIPHFYKELNGKVIPLHVSDLLNGVDLTGARDQQGFGTGRMGVKLFYSYSHKDEVMRNRLESHLKILERTGKITSWLDRNIDAGEDWRMAIDQNLERADIILFLVSADFIASDYCWEKEMQRALERAKENEAKVIPVIIRDVNWKNAPFAHLQALPERGKAVQLWEIEDTAWKSVSEGVEEAADNFLAGNVTNRSEF